MNHGTMTSYFTRRCRCAECRAFGAAYQRSRRQKIRDGVPRQSYKSRYGEEIVHGTTHTYGYRGCRCPLCRTAAADYQRDLKARRSPVDPTTPDEWQAAVDGAYACLVLESARLYGLVTGGPGVDVARCEEILSRGEGMGIRPLSDAVNRFMRDLVSR